MPRSGAWGGQVCTIVLAAGRGKRMRSGRVKLLHVLAGSPMIGHVARAAADLKPRVLAAVVGNQAEEVSAALSAAAEGIRFVEQKQQLGTAHAVLQAERLMRAEGKGCKEVLILNGDVPLIRPSTLRALLRHHRRTGAAATVLSTMVDDPAGYGRVVRGEKRNQLRIVEHRDARRTEARIREVNAGLYCVDSKVLFGALRKTGRANAQGEYYLPDIFPILSRAGRRVEAYLHPEAEEVLGVNDRVELARAAKILYRRMAEDLMKRGVTILDPDCTYVDPRSRVGRDTVLHPMVRLEGETIVGRNATIGAMTRLVDSRVGAGAVVLDMCVITESRIGPGARVGPLAHLRPGTVLEAGVHVGNFVEVKKSRLGKGSKANHLTYLGDATIGKECNIGAGTITCNYDGVEKHPTILEDGVFIGSDTQLVAPVKVGRGAYVGAGATITKEVPAGALAISRAPQRIVEGWVERKTERRRKTQGKH